MSLPASPQTGVAISPTSIRPTVIPRRGGNLPPAPYNLPSHPHPCEFATPYPPCHPEQAKRAEGSTQNSYAEDFSMRAAHLLEMTGAILHSAFPAPLQILTHLRQKSKTFCILHSAFCISRAPTNPNAHLPNSLVGAATCRPCGTMSHSTLVSCEIATSPCAGG